MTQVSKKDYRVVLDALTKLNTPISLSLAILWRYGQVEDIVKYEFSPFNYVDLNRARLDLCAIELIRKNRFISIPSIDKERVALDSFLKAEEECRVTNDRLLRGNPDYNGLYLALSRKIANILGEFDPCELLNRSGWGPGVTLTLKTGDNTLFRKFRHDGEITPLFEPVARVLLSALSPHWRPKLRQYEGNRIITVPKNAKTDRVIAVEPSINLFFQKGIGKMISSRLRKWGIDLRTQVRNQELSRSGSSSGRLATVDFSAASDTISYRLVMDAIPWNWFQVLDCTRSSRGLLGDSFIEYEKFSSMGNGFTFELESLIFFAAALVCCDEKGLDTRHVSVYGDDVIIPVECFSLFSEFSAYLGFSVNKRKSFSSSMFRESCGGYFWNGVSIKPVRLLESVTSSTGAFSFHNRLKDFDEDWWFQEPLFESLCRSLANAEKHPLFVPPSFGDSGFRTSSGGPFYKVRSGNYRFKYRTFESDEDTADDDAVMISQLWRQSRSSVDDELIDRVQSGHGSADVRDVLSPSGNTSPVPRRGKWVVKKANLSHWC